MPADDSRVLPRPRRRRRITATACLVLSVGMLLATPVLLRATRHDAEIQAATTQQADHRRRLLDSGASQEARDLHRDAFERQRDALRIQRRVAFYARAATHFGITLGLFLIWRSLRQPQSHGTSTSR